MINVFRSHLANSIPRRARPIVSFTLVRMCWSASILALPLLTVPHGASHQADAAAAKKKGRAELYAFKIERPNFVVTGANLGKVEVWLWSTGTGITEPGLIGTAKRITNGGKREKWVLRIPPNLLAVEIFATAFDRAGNVTGKKSLPYKDPGALYDAMYGKE